MYILLTNLSGLHCLKIFYRWSDNDSRTNSYIGVEYAAQEAIVKTQDFNRLAFRVNLDHKINENLDIENERRLELAFENHRWYDWVRTGRADEVLGVVDANKWLFPLPYNDVQADEGLVQNPGY